VIVRGLRDLGLGVVVACALTAGASLLLGLAAGMSPSRAVSGGYMLVGSLLFTAGALVGLRDPTRARERERRTAPAASPGAPRSWTEAFHLSAALVCTGLLLVVLGIAIDPRTSI
jgi:hypothetical protein